MSRYLFVFAWAWIIIIGALMITPGGVQCIACGALLTKVLGVISMAIGIGGLVLSRGRLGAVNPVAGRG
jgi:hypothetical protein